MAHLVGRLNEAARLVVGRVKEVSEDVPRSLKRLKNCWHQFSLQAEDGPNKGGLVKVV